ncbi:MAG TPA: ABC transporter permease subunit, partial [Acetobacteraceae bacterium]|nr:ABC transporter permease subunit [Acetobacteraceae bacterium]
PITVQATYICASAMITEAILSFIGAGTPPIIPSWGNIMAEGRALWQVKPYIVFFPALFLSITVLAVNLLGDGLRDALDPRRGKELRVRSFSLSLRERVGVRAVPSGPPSPNPLPEGEGYRRAAHD